MIRRLYWTALVVLLSASNICAQNDRVMRVNNRPDGWDNRNFALAWYHGKDILNINSSKFCSPGVVRDMQISPASTTFAALYLKGKKNEVAVYSYLYGNVKHVFRLQDEPTAITFSANAKQLCIADAGRQIQIFSTADWHLEKTIPIAIAPSQMAVSANNYFVAVADDNLLYVYNMEAGRVRKVLEMEHKINYVIFSPDNDKMAVLTDNGQLNMYETRSFALTETYDDLGNASEAFFHPEGKYIAIITSPERITVLNMKNPDKDRQVIEASEGHVCHLGFAQPVEGGVHLVYNNGNNFVFHPLENLVPDYQHMILSEVEEKMDDWLKQMPGESLEDYHLRVNEETRALQYAKFENEVATQMAGELVEQAQVSLGSYNQEQNILEISFDNMPEIFLEVPQEDIAEFSKPENLEFKNSVYGVTQDDQFELLYTEVTNTESGKTYVFDNMEKQSLDYLFADDNFVPLDLIQQSSMEEVKLQEIREEVMQEAKQASLISEHTHIDVKTKVEASTDADGNKIMNYAVEFHYDVEPEFSAVEDFGPGKYIIEQSESALAMLRIVQNAFENEFKQYIRPGKKVQIRVTGSADAAPITRRIAYAEEYGAYDEALVYSGNELSTISVSRETGITSNQQLAFVRAMGVKHYTEQHLSALRSMQTDYEAHINVSSERGAEFRRIGIKFIFVDAFE